MCAHASVYVCSHTCSGCVRVLVCVYVLVCACLVCVYVLICWSVCAYTDVSMYCVCAECVYVLKLCCVHVLIICVSACARCLCSGVCLYVGACLCPHTRAGMHACAAVGLRVCVSRALVNPGELPAGCLASSCGTWHHCPPEPPVTSLGPLLDTTSHFPLTSPLIGEEKSQPFGNERILSNSMRGWVETRVPGFQARLTGEGRNAS